MRKPIITTLLTSFMSLTTLAGNVFAAGKMVTYKIDNQEYEGYVTGSGEKGAVLVVHNWYGLSDETKSKAEELAKLGYMAFAADIFGKGIRPKNPDDAKKTTAPFYSDRELIRKRAAAGLKELVKIAGPKQKNFAATGYCFGGTTVVELARSGADLKGVVSFHGGLDSPKPEDGNKIKARVLALHGADDPYVSAENLAAFESEMRTHTVDWQLLKFGGAVHSFTDKSAGSDNSKGAAYNALADKRSWKAMENFLTESFN
jgi:dienelactone hydrolase